jgi:glucokinase
VGAVQVLAVDIGGTKLAAGVVDAAGTIVSSDRGPTPTQGGAEALFDAVVAVAESALRRTARDGAGAVAPIAVGVGCGGPMEPGGEAVSPLNIAVWRHFPLRARLAAQLDLPTFVDNDAKALARAEGWLGAAAGARDYIGMVVSTGVGGGIVVDGRLLEGASGNAGHIGHVVVEPDGRPCACGGRGCLEAEASGPSIEAAFGVAPADAPEPVRARTGTLVGRAVASLVSALDIRLAAVAGSVALGFGTPFFEAANAEVRLRCGLSYTEGAVIVPAVLGDRGPLIGAAAVAFAGLPSP